MVWYVLLVMLQKAATMNRWITEKSITHTTDSTVVKTAGAPCYYHFEFLNFIYSTLLFSSPLKEKSDFIERMFQPRLNFSP